jgi:hypothetical protein
MQVESVDQLPNLQKEDRGVVVKVVDEKYIWTGIKWMTERFVYSYAKELGERNNGNITVCFGDYRVTYVHAKETP